MRGGKAAVSGTQFALASMAQLSHRERIVYTLFLLEAPALTHAFMRSRLCDGANDQQWRGRAADHGDCATRSISMGD
jgi:hypothetical protein